MKRLTLEVSPKPFRDMSDDGIRATVRTIARQWGPLIHDVERVAFMLWTADGSEILDYDGNMEAELDWARWVGIGNIPPVPHWDPEQKSLHANRWAYCENPPRLTYERLGRIVSILKEEVGKITGKSVIVGTTFDPGPEFAESDFKYTRHKEISVGATMGEGYWVNCAAVLHGDTRPYAGFPQGIPEGTTLGTFLGKQSQRFLTDLGFDYIWFSNGFAFALAAWNVTGEVFDGKKFDTAGAPAVREKILRFWADFRAGCPDIPIETRGSNLSTGMDLSAHSSPVREIYRGGFNFTAPVNSPWAALNGDYGLELIGWLSHIAELPQTPSGESNIPFRFYIHDPWWANSPWLDRYGREPNDIYLPLSACRIAGDGTATKPGSVSMLTIDDSWGRMPDVVPNEVIPHVQQALRDFPDAPGLATWVYPFDEYHDWTFKDSGKRVNEVFFGDWFMRAAVNQGFPLNTAVSTRNFVKAKAASPGRFDGTVLVSPAPEKDSEVARLLLEHVEKGGSVLFYGPLRHADPRVLDLLGLKLGAPLEGELDFSTTLPSDVLAEGAFPTRINLRALTAGGGIEELHADGAKSAVLAEVSSGGEKRTFSVVRRLPGGGTAAWFRGCPAERISENFWEMLPIRDNPSEWFASERLMRALLGKFGHVLRFRKPSVQTVDPLVLAARCRGGWFFSGFSPSTNVQLQWSFPEGIPVPVGCDVSIGKGDPLGTMSLARAWHRECRVFVDQPQGGEVSCRENLTGVAFGIQRRLLVRGVKDATVTFLRENGTAPVCIQDVGHYTGMGTVYPAESSPDRVVAKNISGDILISW